MNVMNRSLNPEAPGRDYARRRVEAELRESGYLHRKEEAEAEYWYTRKSPASSGYGWLETEPLFVQRLDKDAVLVYDESHTCAAILDRDIEQGHEVLTVNGEVINWHGNYYYVDRIRQEAMFGRPELHDAINNSAHAAPGQAEDNYVNKLTCGHEVDTETELPHCFPVYCSVHGDQTVVNPSGQTFTTWYTRDGYRIFTYTYGTIFAKTQTDALREAARTGIHPNPSIHDWNMAIRADENAAAAAATAP
jgi:hypothetical protein